MNVWQISWDSLRWESTPSRHPQKNVLNAIHATYNILLQREPTKTMQGFFGWVVLFGVDFIPALEVTLWWMFLMRKTNPDDRHRKRHDQIDKLVLVPCWGWVDVWYAVSFDLGWVTNGTFTDNLSKNIQWKVSNHCVVGSLEFSGIEVMPWWIPWVVLRRRSGQIRRAVFI